MEYGPKAKPSTGVLERVPTTVFLLLGVNRQDAHSMGMVGCGMQLDDEGEYAWRETTVSLDVRNSHVCIFLETKKILPLDLPNAPSFKRVPILVMEEYIKVYPNIVRFLEQYRRNRFIRLGPRAFLDPWELDSRDSFILSLDDEMFSSYFLADPRGKPLFSEAASRSGRHAPMLLRSLPGLPDPGVGSWI
jgi:hypothetical protein